MLIPFHTNCREGWGCHPDCPVLQLARKTEELEKALSVLLSDIEKKSQKKKTNE